MGISVYTRDELDSGTHLITCPLDLAITPEVAWKSICCLYPSARAKPPWPPRIQVATYLCLQWISDDLPAFEQWPKGLLYWRYIAAFLPRERSLTPLRFTDEEHDLLKGTPLQKVVIDRKKQLLTDWKLALRKTELTAQELTLSMYTDAATLIASRDLSPTRLTLPQDGSSRASGETYDLQGPVLIPGLDLFNHKQAPPLIRLSTPVTRTNPCVTAVNPSPIPAASQIFTNYGKANEELLMNHGFVVPDNPNDTYGFYYGRSFKVTPRMRRIMKDKGMDHRKRFEFTKEGDCQRTCTTTCGPNCLTVRDDDRDDAEHYKDRQSDRLTLQVRVIYNLFFEVSQKGKDKVYQADDSGDQCRPKVAKMCREYTGSQRQILQKAIDGLEQKAFDLDVRRLRQEIAEERRIEQMRRGYEDRRAM